MRILSRYVLKEFLAPLGYCLAGFSMIFIIFDLFDNLSKIIESRPSVAFMGRYYISYVSFYGEWLIPAALLLASLYTMWRFSHNNEIMAMRTGGVGFVRITAPMLMVAAVLALGTALLNEFFAPQAGAWAKRISRNRFQPIDEDLRTGIPYYNRQKGRIWYIENMDYDEPFRLNGVSITQERPDRTREVEILAERAEYLDGVWWLFNPRKQSYNARDERMPPASDSPSPEPLISMPFLEERPSDLVNELKEWEFFSLREMLRFLEIHGETLPERAIAEKRYGVFFRMASPWSAWIITLFAIPAGVASGRQGMSRGVLLAIGLFVVFFALSQICMFFGQQGILPPTIGPWIPNLVFLFAGILMYYRQR